MTINLAIGPIVSLIAGVLILIVPRLLNYIVAIYLIVIGLVGVLGWSGTHIHATATENVPVLAAPDRAPERVTAGAPAPSVVDARAMVAGV